MIEFDSIVVQTRCRVKLIHGDQSSFTNYENGEKADWINMSIVNKQLVLYTKPEYYGYLLLHDYYPQIMITYKTLTALQMLDRCFVESVETLKLQKLGLIVRDGLLDISVNAFLIDCTVLKGARAKISGEATVSYILTHNISVYDGSKLDTSEGIVRAYDKSRVSIWFEDDVDLGLFGSSKLEYRGNPRMEILNIDEGCALKQINDKVEIKNYQL